MSPTWWAAFGPADTSVRCGEAEHRLRWADGSLHALDHPDAEGELVLGALGADTSPCLGLIMTWGKHCDDLAVLAIGPRSASDRLTFPAGLRDEITALGAAGQAYFGAGMPVPRLGGSGGGFIGRPAPGRRAMAYGPGWVSAPGSRPHRRGARAFGSRGGPPPIPGMAVRHLALRRRKLLGGSDADLAARIELIRLLALGSPFQFRLSAAVAHAWSADGATKERGRRARPALTAALASRVAPAAGHWLGVDPDEVEVTVHDEAGWGELALTERGGSGQLRARLPVGWLASVWAPGFAVVDGRLVVSVLDAAWPTARVLAVRSPGQDPAELTIRDDGGHWSVTSR